MVPGPHETSSNDENETEALLMSDVPLDQRKKSSSSSSSS
eukprot:CAMPEP_0183313248 /NCGR_PEP_ID=MMETSP0160_2-20130417/44609_1 /TAXON_ID=2839 ORGANISM="Odontella Sinensis, Strain Grunow 1884" /NCGR_SAMPLE_ID=MMETSP0160_2 /ASSEMBLY_ACC=CAM_ASM_000250 /LENGTH=39 /DNA_ID= /DNA_START= /DNA_END= /DNA_ORIENTATION=